MNTTLQDEALEQARRTVCNHYWQVNHDSEPLYKCSKCGCLVYEVADDISHQWGLSDARAAELRAAADALEGR